MERQTFLAQKNANLTGEVPKEMREKARKVRMDRMLLNPPEALQDFSLSV